jgi:hypothetical protein
MSQDFTGYKNEIAINNCSHLTSFSKSLKPTLYCLTQALNVKIANIFNIYIYIYRFSSCSLYTQDVRFKAK